MGEIIDLIATALADTHDGGFDDQARFVLRVMRQNPGLWPLAEIELRVGAMASPRATLAAFFAIVAA